jgi:LPXTG-motif cell wall-anchored protein
VVKSVEVREAEIVQRIGQTVIYRDKLGQINKITGVPEGWIVYRDGKPVPIEALAGGDRVTAYIVHKEYSQITEEEMKVAGTAPKAPAAPKPVAAPKPAPAPAPAPVLPKTGSELPLVGLAGLMALAIGLGIAVVRR